MFNRPHFEIGDRCGRPLSSRHSGTGQVASKWDASPRPRPGARGPRAVGLAGRPLGLLAPA